MLLNITICPAGEQVFFDFLCIYVKNFEPDLLKQNV